MKLLDEEENVEEVELDYKNVFIAVLLFLSNGVLSVYFELGLNRKLTIAAIRCIIQLLILSLFLRPIFSMDQWWFVLFFAFVMIFIASIEVMSRPSYSYTVFKYLN